VHRAGAALPSGPKPSIEERSPPRAEHGNRSHDLLLAVFNDALADNVPLGRLLAKYVTKDMLKEVAQEHEQGRLLLMATTNLDAPPGL